MRPLSEWRAKPLAPVGDTPALAQVIGGLRRGGVTRIVVNAHHRVEDLRAFMRSCGERFVLSEESSLLGTAGGVAHARPLLGDGDVLVWNGDILAEIDLPALRSAHRHEATLVVRPGAPGSGNVGIAEDGRIVRLRGETTATGESQGGEFLGIHVIGAALVRGLPSRGCLVGDVYLPALRRGARLDAFHTDAPFWDIGTIPTYLAANVAWLAARGLSSWVAPDAAVDPRATLEGALVHSRARIAGPGRLARVVVWEDADAVGPIEDAVVTRAGIARL
jgi:mannose-1-phosphate guanylyltransferase